MGILYMKKEKDMSKAAGVHHQNETHHGHDHHLSTTHSHSLPPNPFPNSVKISLPFSLFYTKLD